MDLEPARVRAIIRQKDCQKQRPNSEPPAEKGRPVVVPWLILINLNHLFIDFNNIEYLMYEYNYHLSSIKSSLSIFD